MITIMAKRPRFDYSADYFSTSYQYEDELLQLHCDLIKSILNQHIQSQREYVQKLYRDEIQRFGIPLKIIPIQNISVGTSQPALKSIYMLEFHPTISSISSISAALHTSYRGLLHMHQPKTITERVVLEIKLFQCAQRLWDKKPSHGSTYSNHVKKDVFSEVFVEDPLFVCEIGESLTALKDVRGVVYLFIRQISLNLNK